MVQQEKQAGRLQPTAKQVTNPVGLAELALRPFVEMRTTPVKAKRESKYVEFKRTFNPDDSGEWCELIKDLVAIANAGGGVILVGVEDNGAVGDVSCVDAVLSLDSAIITDKLARYTGVQFDGVSIERADRDKEQIAIMYVEGASMPLVFAKPGTYAVDGGRQKKCIQEVGGSNPPAPVALSAIFIRRYGEWPADAVGRPFSRGSTWEVAGARAIGQRCLRDLAQSTAVNRSREMRS